MTGTIDLNADSGEGSGPEAEDPEILSAVSTAHIACGFHAGGPEVMRRAVTAALRAGVAVGAHPSYPDVEGFGRRPLDRPADLVADDVLYQIGALASIARACGAEMVSVKPHGALYHRVAGDRAVALAVARAVRSFDPALHLVVAAGAPTWDDLASVGLTLVAEGFCDRAYESDGTLASRDRPGAVLHDPEVAARQAVSIAVDGVAATVDGRPVAVTAATLCLHGDTPGAPAVARAVRRALETAGVLVAAPAR